MYFTARYDASCKEHQHQMAPRPDLSRVFGSGPWKLPTLRPFKRVNSLRIQRTPNFKRHEPQRPKALPLALHSVDRWQPAPGLLGNSERLSWPSVYLGLGFVSIPLSRLFQINQRPSEDCPWFHAVWSSAFSQPAAVGT